jgi:hypothetical protein
VCFLAEEVPFLGHIISAEGITVDPGKVQEVDIIADSSQTSPMEFYGSRTDSCF